MIVTRLCDISLDLRACESRCAFLNSRPTQRRLELFLASPSRILESSEFVAVSPHGAGETKELIGFVFAKSILYEPIPVISINYTTHTHYSYSNTIIDSLDLGGLSRPQNNGGQPIQEMHNTSLHAKGASRWAILTTPFRDRCAIRLPASNKMRRCSRIVDACSRKFTQRAGGGGTFSPWRSRCIRSSSCKTFNIFRVRWFS